MPVLDFVVDKFELWSWLCVLNKLQRVIFLECKISAMYFTFLLLK